MHAIIGGPTHWFLVHDCITEVKKKLGYRVRMMLRLIRKRILHVRMRSLKADV